MREFTFCNDGERGRLVGFHAYDLGDSLRRLALPKNMPHW
jgi:hypothetical protein